MVLLKHLKIFPFFILLIHFYGYDCTRGETAAIPRNDVQHLKNCTFSASEKLNIFNDSKIQLITEEWNAEDKVIAFIEYPDAPESNESLVMNLSMGSITLFYGMNISYTVFYENLDGKAQEKTIKFSHEDCRRGDVSERQIDPAMNRPFTYNAGRAITLPVVITLGLIALAGIALGVGVYCWKRRKRVPDDPENGQMALAAHYRVLDQNPHLDLNPNQDPDLDLNPNQDQHLG